MLSNHLDRRLKEFWSKQDHVEVMRDICEKSLRYGGTILRIEVWGEDDMYTALVPAHLVKDMLDAYERNPK